MEVENVEEIKSRWQRGTGVKPNANASPYCSTCYIEMCQANTKLKIDSWKSPRQQLSQDELSVTMCLCMQCGKIKFKSDKP